MATQAARVDTYCAMERPARKGQIRRQTWRMDVIDMIPAEQSPKWRQRAADYWSLQARTYGLVMSDFTLATDLENRVVYTHSMVLDVLPGQRLKRRIYERATR